MDEVISDKNEQASNPQFPVVGIGASAGGLEAVKLFLQSIPERSGMAYVFVQHLSPNHVSVLPELLQTVSKIPVQQITDNIHLKQDHFYIIPENKIVTATDGVLRLAPLDEKHHKVKIIDLFFTSMAVVYQSFAVGIVLSGTLNDGSAGLQVIKGYGGITFAQDEGSAAFDGMPKNAVNTGAVDFILPPEKIASKLISINHPFEITYSKNGKPASVPKHDEEVFKQILTVLRVRRGIDFAYYKPNTLKRRIVRRMALNRIEKADKYLALLRENKNEQDALYNDMLISVTNFFRDPQSFEFLCSTIFPELINQKTTNNEPLRIWVAGCATGEEAYSMAICLQEFLGDRTAAVKIQIFATDVSETAIGKARMGVYKSTEVEGISSSRLKQFFTKLDGNYQVNKSIRDICVFAHHNLLKDPPFSKIDLISCRNVLIYLEPVLQKRALTTFHYSLNEKGFLMLGKSESIGQNTDLFSIYNNHEKIFLRKGSRGRFMHVTSVNSEQAFHDLDKNIQPAGSNKDIFKIAEELILSKYTPAGVLVNGHHDIIQFRGTTDSWLAPPPGKATLNVLKMVREGLSFELRTLLHLAKKTNLPAGKKGLVFKVNGKQLYTDLEVIPLMDVAEPHYLILFENSAPSTINRLTAVNNIPSTSDPRDRRIEQLEKEIAQAREDMRAITEEQEAANEELQSSNEELLSGSEELQSLNEELETSKEELQSANEEIIIVNNELLERIEQVDHARQYTEAIVNTIRDPLLILDRNLKVKRATKGFLTKFNLSEEETEGHYLYDLNNRQWNMPALRELLESILPEKKVSANLEVTHTFPLIGRKIMLLNARQLDSIQGEQLILLSIEDITDKRKVEEGLAEVEKLFAESKERLKFAVESAGLGTWDFYPATGELIWDRRCKELFGLLPSEHVDYNVFLESLHPDDRENTDEVVKRTLQGANNGEYEIEYRTLKNRWIKAKGKAYFNDKVANRFIGTVLDITIQKQTEENTLELLKKKDEFISIASHELKTPLTSLKAGFQLVDRFVKADTMVTERLKQMVDKSNINLKKLTNLVDSLLNASQIDGGQLRINKTWFTLSEVIEESCDHIRIEGKYRIITTGDLSLKIHADRDKIEQVIVNIVNNAVKYAPIATEVVIHIQKSSTMAKVSVKDSGPGITVEKIPNLFDRYYRVDNEGIQYSGLGLGLYICSEIIKKHNGQIGVESEVGSGSTFWFTIPIE